MKINPKNRTSIVSEKVFPFAKLFLRIYQIKKISNYKLDTEAYCGITLKSLKYIGAQKR